MTVAMMHGERLRIRTVEALKLEDRWSAVRRIEQRVDR